MRNWHYLFEDKILGRGLSYTDDVEIIFRDDEMVKAIVSGTEDYSVEINFDDGEVDEMHCSCPYFDTDNCKHLAALLFVLEDGEETEIEKEDFTELFSSVSDGDLKDFLFAELETNPKLLSKFRLKFSDGVSANYYKTKLDGICFRDDNRYLINDFLSRDMHFLMDKKEYKLVLDLLDDVLPFIKDWWGYWEDYGSDGNIEEFTAIAETLVSTDVHEDLFEYLKSWIFSRPSDYHMEGLIDLYFTEFKTAGELKEKMAFAEMLYEKTENIRWISTKISLMGELGYSAEAIDDFRKDYLDNEEIMDQYIKSSSGTKKEELLRQAIGRFEYNLQYKVQLKDYYRQTESDEYLKVLEDLLFTCPDIEYYRELKKHFDGDWQVKRREIFDSLSDNEGFLNECYADEGMHDLLIANISSIWDLDRYCDLLADDYSGELIEKYSRIAVLKAQKSGPPKHYAQIADILKKIYNLPGGKENAVGIAEDFKVKYKRRPRMLQALREAGF